MISVFFLFSMIFLCCITQTIQEDRFSIFERQSRSWKYYPFDTAMKINTVKDIKKLVQATEQLIGISGKNLYQFFGNLYEQNKPSASLWQDTPKIPKIIHQIWIGSPVPEELRSFLESWLAIHPDWEYTLWTDADLVDFCLENQDLFEKAQNYGTKSDIWRYEILYRHGGVYVDTDFESIESLEFFHHLYHFYTGLQTLDSQLVQLGLALIGSCPGHPMLKKCIEEIRESFKRPGVLQKAGPLHFTRVFYKYANTFPGLIDIAFPAFYFYPLGCTEMVSDHEEAIKAWRKMGTFAVHWWSKTWLPAKHRRKEFSTIKNDYAVTAWNT